MATTKAPQSNISKLNALFVAVIGHWLARWVCIPLDPFWLTSFYSTTYKSAEISDFQIGLANGSFFLFMAISALSMGPLSSNYGRRPCILACLLALSLTLLGSALAFSFTMVLVIRAFFGASVAISGLHQSYIVDVCETNQIFKYSSRMLLIQGVLMTVIPGLAGLMTDGFDNMFKNVPIYDAALQYRCAQIVAALIAFVTFVYCYFKLQESFPIFVHEVTRTSDGEEMRKTLDTIYQKSLPTEYKSKAFKQRLRWYLIALMLATVLIEVCTLAHHLLYPLLNDGNHGGLHWTHLHNSVNICLFGGAMALAQLFHPKKLSILLVAVMASVATIISCVSIPIMNMVCRTYYPDKSSWFQFALHSFISIFGGIGYGGIVTAVSTVFSDLAKKYNHSRVDTWLARWSAANSFGCLLVIPITFVSSRIGISKTIFFVIVPCAVALCALLLYLYCATKDIAMDTDMQTTMEKDEQLAQEDDAAGVDGVGIRHSEDFRQASRASINSFVFAMGSHSFGVMDGVCPAALSGIPVEKMENIDSARSSKLRTVITTGLSDDDEGHEEKASELDTNYHTADAV